MPYAVLEKEIQSLPYDALPEVLDFVRFVKFKISEQEQNVVSKKSMYGELKDKITYISDDFDEPLEEFAEYM